MTNTINEAYLNQFNDAVLAEIERNEKVKDILGHDWLDIYYSLNDFRINETYRNIDLSLGNGEHLASAKQMELRDAFKKIQNAITEFEDLVLTNNTKAE